MQTDKGVRYLMSFLGILVDRAGGTLVIENLSHYAGRDLKLVMELDGKSDKVTLTITETKGHSHAN